MAKKVTIEGSDKLHSLSDPWGGIGDGVNPVYGTLVPEGVEWGMNRGEVESFIKQQFGIKIGWLHRDDDNYLCGFASEDDFNTWRAAQGTEGEEAVASLLLVRVKLPDVVNEDTYRVTLTVQEIPAQVQSNSQVSIAIKGASIINYAAGGTGNNDELLDVYIDTSPSGASGSWVAHKVGSITANDVNYTTYSLESLLSTGVNYLRIRLVGEFASSIPKTFSLTIVNLSLSLGSDLSVPFSDSLFFGFFINGSVQKSLEFQFCTGTEGDFTNIVSYSLDIGDAVSMGSATTYTIPAAKVTEGNLLSDGRHVFRVRLYHNSSIYTDWLVCEYMVGEAGAIIINNIHPRLVNWTNVVFFDWSTHGIDNVVFKMYDETNTTLIDTWSYPAVDLVQNSFAIQLSLDIDSEIQNYGVVLRIVDGDGNTIHPNILFTVENDSTFAPVSGADFVMIPANRDNSEANRATIINEVTNGAVIDQNNVVFDGFGWLNDGWVGVLSDINDNTSEVIRALHVPAHHRVEIPYNPFSDFTGNSNTNRYATFEIDFRTSNILDYSEPIVQIGTVNNGIFWGLELLPTKGYMLTANKTSTFDQDVDWAEDMRVHLAVNIVQSYGLLLIRLFINGTIEREFRYTTDDKFTAASGVKIKIGNTTSDIDIFGIRSYKLSLNTENVMQNYKASLENADDKLAFRDKNDILVGGLINWNKCINAGYNVIGHIGELPHYVKGSDSNPTYGGKDDANGLVKLVINIADDPEHSCTLTNLEAKGQGTTAMTYFHWNQSYKITDATQRYDVNGNLVSGMTGKGYSIANINGQEEALAKKLVGKINFASSMQSHKLGLTWIFTEIYKQLVADGTIAKPIQMNAYPEARISVFEKPFFFFWKPTEDTPEWEFKYLMTFGAGKGDKPTFGYKESDTPSKDTSNMMMVEGADNEPALCNFARPWDEDGIYYKATGEGKEAWYEGRPDNNYIIKSINFGFGKVNKVEGIEYPAEGNPLESLKRFWNFAYIHHTGIQPHAGNFNSLNVDVEADRDCLYWVTSASESSDKYDLYRYNKVTSEWVNAGVNRSKLNLFTQYQSFGGTKTISELNGMTFKNANDEFCSVRRAHFRAHASELFFVDDALYHSCFVKLFAATDNRAKNTYYYTDHSSYTISDPITGSNVTHHKIRWMQDDLDTVLRTNNMGQNRKPYYIEEHDKDESGSFYWMGEANGFYNLLEEAFPIEMRSMMASMLGKMSGIGGSVMNYLRSRILFVQERAFPNIAYNEQARLVYESAQVAQDNNQYTNATAPITQSMGSQFQSEYQWLLDRVMYISSWCEYGMFGAVAGGAPPDSWSFRSGGNGDYDFVLKSSKWIYPRIFSGGSKVDPVLGVTNYRLKPYNESDQDTVLDYQSFHIGNGDIVVAIAGIDYFLEVGDLNVSIQKAGFGFSGKRLRKIAVNEGGNSQAVFAPSSIENVPNNITEFIMRYVVVEGAGNLGTLNLSTCYRLEKIDLTGSEFTSVNLPKTERLTKLTLPASLTSLVLDGQPNIANTSVDANASFSIAGVSNIASIQIKGCPYVPSYSIINAAKTSNAPVTNIALQGINWNGVSAAFMEWLINIPTCRLTGYIFISDTVSFNLRMRMLTKWDNIGVAGDEGLIIEHRTVDVQGAIVCGNSYIWEEGIYQFKVAPTPENANNFTSVSWSVDWDDGVEPIKDIGLVAEIDHTGLLTVKEVFDNQSARIKVTIRIDDDYYSISVGLFYREAEVGDFVYADGSWSDVYNPLKTVVGVCFVSEIVNGSLLRLMVATKNLTYTTSTGTNTSLMAWGLNSAVLGGLVPVDNVSYFQPTVKINNNVRYVYDVPTISSLEANAVSISKTNTLVTQAWIDGNFYGFKDGDILPRGQINTLKIIRHRNLLLSDSAFNDLTPIIPREDGGTTEYQDVELQMGNIKNRAQELELASYSNYYLCYFPALSFCFAYKPTVKNGEELADKFKEHNWWLPSLVELARFTYYAIKGYTEGVEDAIFAKAYNCGAFTKHTNGSYKSAEEYSNGDKESPTLGIQASSGSFSYNTKKSDQQYVRPICKF